MAEPALKIEPAAAVTAATTDTKAAVVDTKTAATIADSTAVLGAAATTTDTKTAAVIDPAAAATAANDWKVPDNWRENIAKGDEKFLGELKRFSSFDKYVESSWNLRRRLSAGEFKRPLSDSPSEDELKTYRAENGIPDKPEGYTLPDGLQIGEEDKPIIDEFKKFSHAKNRSADEVKDIVDWYYKAQTQAREQMLEADEAYRTQSDDALHATWGGEYRQNLTAMRSFVKTTSNDAFYNKLMSARLGDGTILGNNVEALTWLTQLAVERNPAATVVPGGAGATIDSVNGRIAEINKMMSNDPPGARDAYFKDDKLQAEYRNLIDARDKYAQMGKTA